MNFEDTITGLLDKSLKLEDLDLNKEQVDEIQNMLESLKKSSLDSQGVDTGESMAMSTEVIKFDKCGQWKIEKAAKPGKPLVYSSLTSQLKDKQKEHQANASPTQNYAEHETGPEIERRLTQQKAKEARRIAAEKKGIKPNFDKPEVKLPTDEETDKRTAAQVIADRQKNKKF